MSQKVKCEFCWKVFEISDDHLDKKRQCPFCQRMTKGTLQEKEEILEKNIEILPEKNTNEITINISLILLAILTLFNLFNLSLSFSKKNYPEVVKEILQENPEWKTNLESNLENLKKDIEDINLQLKNINSTLNTENMLPKLIDGFAPSIRFTRDKITELEEKTKKLRNLLLELENEKNKLETRVNNLNKE